MKKIKKLKLQQTTTVGQPSLIQRAWNYLVGFSYLQLLYKMLFAVVEDYAVKNTDLITIACWLIFIVSVIRGEIPLLKLDPNKKLKFTTAYALCVLVTAAIPLSMIYGYSKSKANKNLEQIGNLQKENAELKRKLNKGKTSIKVWFRDEREKIDLGPGDQPEPKITFNFIVQVNNLSQYSKSIKIYMKDVLGRIPTTWRYQSGGLNVIGSNEPPLTNYEMKLPGNDMLLLNLRAVFITTDQNVPKYYDELKSLSDHLEIRVVASTEFGEVSTSSKKFLFRKSIVQRYKETFSDSFEKWGYPQDLAGEIK